MSNVQFIVLTLVLALSVMLTRFLPFVLFGKKEVPSLVKYLGKVLPAAMMGLLVVYCYKDFDWAGGIVAVLPALVAGASVVGIHLWKRNTILSITLGTVVYMVLIRVL